MRNWHEIVLVTISSLAIETRAMKRLGAIFALCSPYPAGSSTKVVLLVGFADEAGKFRPGSQVVSDEFIVSHKQLQKKPEPRAVIEYVEKKFDAVLKRMAKTSNRNMNA